MKLACSLLAITVTTLSAYAASRTEGVIDAAVLARFPASYADQSTWVAGCLTQHQHGTFISPCNDDDWHNITRVYDTQNLVRAAVPSLRGPKIFYEVQGTFHGVLDTSGTRNVFRLDAVDGLVIYEP